MPKISVIIPTYNCEEYLCRAIDSVINQVFSDYEIIIIDDGSIDKTKNLIDIYITKYYGKIKYFYQDRLGVSAARNNGLHKATGEYIAFLDSDDLWLPDKLKLQINLMSLYSNVYMVFTDSELFTENGGILRDSMSRSRLPQKKGSFRYKVLQKNLNDESIIIGNLYNDLILCNFIATSTVFIRSAVLEKVGYFSEEFTVAEDYDLWIRISQKHEIIYLNKVTAKYMVRNNGLSGPIDIRTCRWEEGFGKVFEKHLIHSPRELKRVIKKRIINSYKEACWGYLNLLEFKKVKELSLRSLKYNRLQLKLYLYILFSILPQKILLYLKRTQ